MEPDILYAVRPGEQNEALRLSLRSLGNLPHRRVFIAGHCPQWVRGVTEVEVRRKVNKFDAIEENVRQGVWHPEISDDVVYMNDDFYFLRPTSSVPVTHGGPASEFAGVQELRLRMRQTLRCLGDLPFPLVEMAEPLAYDGVHMPLPLSAARAREALAKSPRNTLWRTWYGNFWALGGTRVPNAKVKGDDASVLEGLTHLSTSPRTLRVFRDALESILPQESPYV